jgi:hypothetical protein
MDIGTLLKAIGSQEESTFGEICNALGDNRPGKGDRSGWKEFFDLVRRAESEGLIDTSKDGSGRLETAILTEAGAAKVRGMLS